MAAAYDVDILATTRVLAATFIGFGIAKTRVDGSVAKFARAAKENRILAASFGFAPVPISRHIL